MEAYSEKVEAEIEFHKQKITALEKFIIPNKYKGEKASVYGVSSKREKKMYRSAGKFEKQQRF